MFERFDDQARRVIVHAQEEARLLSHNYIGTEHILLGIAREGSGVAVEALTALDVSLQAMRQQVVQIVGLGQNATSGHIPFTPRAKKVLELSLREALQLGQNYIGAEHILLGLIREGEGVGAQVLVRLGADLNRVRRQVIQLTTQHEGSQDAPEHEIRQPGASAGSRGWQVEVLAALADIQRRLTMVERHLAISEVMRTTAEGASDQPGDSDSDQPGDSAAGGDGGHLPAREPDTAEPVEPGESAPGDV